MLWRLSNDAALLQYVLTIQAEVSFRLFYFYYLALFFKHLLWIDNQRPITQHTGTVTVYF